MNVDFSKLDSGLNSTPSTIISSTRSDLSKALANLSTGKHAHSTETPTSPGPKSASDERHNNKNIINIINNNNNTINNKGNTDVQDDVIVSLESHDDDDANHSSREHSRGLLSPRMRPIRDGKRLLSGALASFDAAGVITPALLAKFHLPTILINRGPLSVRSITAYLTINVPGFSFIPPAKQRRLVVSALEGQISVRANSPARPGEVIFEKIGWGKWAARITAMPQAPHASSIDISHPVRASTDTSITDVNMHGMKYEGHDHLHIRSPGLDSSVGSWSNESGIFLQDEDIDGPRRGHHAKSRLPSFALTSDSEDPNQQMYSDLDDMTDEEDWEAIGIEGLKRGSSASPLAPSSYAKSPASYGQHLAPGGPTNNFTEQEAQQAAIEALIRLGGSY